MVTSLLSTRKWLPASLLLKQTYMKTHILPPNCLWPPGSPLSCVGPWMPPPPGSTSNPIIQSKSSHEQGIEIITFVGEQWSHKGCPKLEERDKDRSKITKQTGLEHVRMKVTKSVHIDALWALILMLPLTWNHSFYFSRFAQSVPNLVPKSLQNWVLWVPMGAKRQQERDVEVMQQTSPQKYQHMSQICSKRRVPASEFFVFVLGSPAQDGLQGVPRQAPRPKSMLKWRPRDVFSSILS